MARVPRIVVSTPIEHAEVGASPYAAKRTSLPVPYDTKAAQAYLRTAPPSSTDRATVLLPARQEWALKGNDTLIRGIAALDEPLRRGVAIEIVDWGIDAPRTRTLVATLGLEAQTTYRPLLSKTELWRVCGRPGVIVLDQAPPYNVYGGGLGGVARDALAVGAVLVTHAAPSAQRTIFRTEPPIWHIDCNVTSVRDALASVLALSPEARREQGQAGAAWLAAECDPSIVVPAAVALHTLRPSRP